MAASLCDLHRAGRGVQFCEGLFQKAVLAVHRLILLSFGKQRSNGKGGVTYEATADSRAAERELLRRYGFFSVVLPRCRRP
jgi:hypothetical protein